MRISHGADLLDPIRFQTKSARLEALQLNVSVEDETNVIGLQRWGNNPAGHLLDEPKSRMVTGASFIDEDSATGNTYGLYASRRTETRAVYFDGGRQSQHVESSPFGVPADTSQWTGELGYGQKIGSLFLGATVDRFAEKIDAATFSKKSHSDPVSFNGGAGRRFSLRSGFLDTGFNFRQERAHIDTYETVTSEPGVQVIFRGERRFIVGAAFDYKNKDYRNYDNAPIWGRTLSIRGLVKPKSEGVRFGGEIISSNSRGLHDADFTGDVDAKIDRLCVNAGASFYSSELGLAGIEISKDKTHQVLNASPGVQPSFTYDTIKVSFGCELKISPSAFLRFSLSKVKTDITASGVDSAIDSQIVGFGFGAPLGSRGKLDVSMNKKTEDAGNVDNDTQTISLVSTLYF